MSKKKSLTTTPKSESKKSKESTNSNSNDDDEKIDEIDVRGMNLTNPNYFFERMHERDPKLFLTKKQGQFNAYSRICAHNMRKQPVIITQEEKDKIDRLHPGSYSEAIKYGSSPETQHYYICPRYWCLKNNTSLTEEDVKNGECGGKIIPPNAKKVPNDAFIFEFATAPGTRAYQDFFDKSGKYITHYPGFVKEGSHPDNLCLPCCFKSWTAPQQVRRRKQCLIDEKQKESERPIKEKPKKLIEKDEYIKGPEKYPLDQHRWGFLPLSIQTLFGIDNKKCQISEINKEIKPFHTCLLRKGVEISEKQSFIACIADLYVEFIKQSTVLSIQEMKNVIISATTIDKFIIYQNGSLISSFAADHISSNIEDYSESELYKNMDLTKETNKEMLKNIVASYENFIDFLKDDDIIIDYKYLWDIVCMPNKKLFPGGLNLVVINIPKNDMTDNVEIICPSTHYSNHAFNIRKNTLILIQQHNYFEPIYIYRDEETTINITKTFNIYGKNISESLKKKIRMFGNILLADCLPLASLPKTYTFKNPIKLHKLLDELKEIGFRIVKQVINYDLKVIGLIVTNGEKQGFIPCYPSGLLEDIEYSSIDSSENWTTYEKTLQFLKHILQLSNSRIPCKPMIKIVDDGLLVGILSETNQFIALKMPEASIPDDELPIQEGKNYIEYDKIIKFNNTEDKERINTVKRIKIETQMYTIFRNTIRILINKFENSKIKKELEEIIKESYLLYNEKLNNVERILKEISTNHLTFSEFSVDSIDDINELSSCINLDSDKCSKKTFCLVDDDMSCKIILPKTNLISKSSNEEIYFARVSDELIRYGRIRDFILSEQTYLSLDSIDYNLKDNEIILLETLLYSDYFDDLVLSNKNKYVKNEGVDYINPEKTTKYSNIFTDEVVDKIKDIKVDCITKKYDKVRGSISAFFSKKCYELEYTDSVVCTLQVIVKIYNDYNEKKITIQELRQILLTVYEPLLKDNTLKILSILKDEEKSKILRDIRRGSIVFQDLILSESYYLTNFDIWILCNHLKIPLILAYNKGITFNKKPLFLTYFDETIKHYYIIKHSGYDKETHMMKYSIIYCNENMRHSLDSFPDLTRRILEKEKVDTQKRDIKTYIENYETKKVKKLIIK